MTISCKQIAIAIRGLFREGRKTITIRQLRHHLNCLDHSLNFCEKNERPQWFWDALNINHPDASLVGDKNCWDIWEFSDRFLKAIRRMVKKGQLKVERYITPRGCTSHSVIILRDFTAKELFGKDRLKVLVIKGIA